MSGSMQPKENSTTTAPESAGGGAIGLVGNRVGSSSASLLAQEYMDATRRASHSAGLEPTFFVLPGTVKAAAAALENKDAPQLPPKILNESFKSGGIEMPASFEQPPIGPIQLNKQSTSPEAAAEAEGELKKEDGKKQPRKTSSTKLPKFNVTPKDPRLKRMAGDVSKYLKLDSDTATRLSMIYLCSESRFFESLLDALSILRDGLNVCISQDLNAVKKPAVLTLTQSDPLALEMKSGRIFSSVRTIGIPRLTCVNCKEKIITINADSMEFYIKFNQEATALKVFNVIQLILGRGNPLYDLGAKKTDGQVFRFDG